MKLNSIGSVTPVRNEVSASEASMPPTAARRSGRALRHIARHAAGRPNIITGKKPLMNAPAVGSPAKKRFRSPVAPWIVADDEPGDVVEDVVQAGDDQQPVQHAVDEEAERTGARRWRG